MAVGIRYLDGPRLQRCLAAGFSKLATRRNYLNQINVFPVPDGDTGNNLAYTATAAGHALTTNETQNAGEVLENVANAALDSAQGNSGALLAQFLLGLANSARDKVRLSTGDFAAAVAVAAQATRAALDQPREGTIITAMDVSAGAAADHNASNDFTQLLPAMLAAVRQAVAASTAQLDELRSANVVDAGAAGFCAILEGCTEFLLHGSIRDVPSSPPPEETESPHGHQIFDIRFRYCTECLLSGTAMNPANLRTRLLQMGDSLVVAGSDTRLRIHIHTDEPERVFELAAEFGTVEKTKADDMVGQARALSRHDRQIAIVTDSAADLPTDVIEELDIQIVPLRVSFGEQSYLDKIGMTSEQFRSELVSTSARPGTSQPTVGDLRRTYDFLLTHFSQVVAVHLSAGLSGTMQAAKNAAASTTDNSRLTLLDSKNASVGQGLIVKRAAELAAANTDLEQIIASAGHEINTVRTFALVTDLGAAVRSGRLRPGVRRLADWLHLTPVLTNTTEGKVGVHCFLPGRHRLVERFARQISKAVGTNGNWEIAIAGSAADSARAELLDECLRARLENATDTLNTDIGPAFGVHAGMDSLVVALRRCD